MILNFACRPFGLISFVNQCYSSAQAHVAEVSPLHEKKAQGKHA